MKKWIIGTALLVMGVGAVAGHHEKGEHEMPPMSAEEMAMMKAMQAAATVGEAHKMLSEGAGTYTANMKMWPGPGAEPMTTVMKVERSMELDGRVLVDHWKGEVMGAPFMGLGRTGYDNVTKRFWTTWTDNMSTGVLVMYGDWDAEKNTLAFTGDAVHPASGATYAVRSVGSAMSKDGDTMTMYEDHGQGEYPSMSFTLTPLK